MMNSKTTNKYNQLCENIMESQLVSEEQLRSDIGEEEVDAIIEGMKSD
jgi:hypothetical protein